MLHCIPEKLTDHMKEIHLFGIIPNVAVVFKSEWMKYDYYYYHHHHHQITFTVLVGHVLYFQVE
jgi:hypothetical protein